MIFKSHKSLALMKVIIKLAQNKQKKYKSNKQQTITLYNLIFQMKVQDQRIS